MYLHNLKVQGKYVVTFMHNGQIIGSDHVKYGHSAKAPVIDYTSYGGYDIILLVGVIHLTLLKVILQQH